MGEWRCAVCETGDWVMVGGSVERGTKIIIVEEKNVVGHVFTIAICTIIERLDTSILYHIFK